MSEHASPLQDVLQVRQLQLQNRRLGVDEASEVPPPPPTPPLTVSTLLYGWK